MRRLLILLALQVMFGSFLIGQAINSFPHYEDFENFSTCATVCQVPCVLTNGWMNSTSDSTYWTTDHSGTPTLNTGPTADNGADHNPGTTGGQYLYIESSVPCNIFKTASIYTPHIDLDWPVAITMEFWYHMFGSTMGELHVDLSQDSGATWSLDIVSMESGDKGDIWKKKTVDLSPWMGDSIQIRIRGITGLGITSDLAIDDFAWFGLIGVDAGICSIDSPASFNCALSNEIYVSLANFGTDTLDSAQVYWTINGDTATNAPLDWYGPLLPGEKDSLLFLGADTLYDGDTIVVWTANPNDTTEGPGGNVNDSMMIIIGIGLNGTYSIGAQGNDYPDFGAAIADMEARGLCGPVVFEVYDTLFDEQIVLNEIEHASAINTITFKSASGNRDSVILGFLPTISTDNYTIKFNGGDYFRFENITVQNMDTLYGRAIEFVGKSNWNIISGCHIQGRNIPVNVSTDFALVYSPGGVSQDNDNLFFQNTFSGGSYGIYFRGDNFTSQESGTVIKENIFKNYFQPLYLKYQDYPKVIANIFESDSSSFTGSMRRINLENCYNEVEVKRNYLKGLKPGTGIYLSNCGGSSTRRASISDNFIHIGNPSSAIVSYGIYMLNSGFHDIDNNSIHLESFSAASCGLYFAGGGSNAVRNNIIMSSGPGYGIFYNDSWTFLQSDFNDFYAPITTKIIHFAGVDYPDLASFQAASGFDLNSLSINPKFATTEDFHTCNDSLNNMGTPATSSTNDFDNELRSLVTPDIGADEFRNIGTYTLGPDTSFCLGDSILIFSGVGPLDTVLWQPTGDTVTNLWVSIAGTYSVEVKTECGAAVDTINVMQASQSYSNFIVADTTQACMGDTITLSSSIMANDYTWTPGAFTTPTIQVLASATYTLEITDGCGGGTDAVNITFVSPPTASFSSFTSFLTCAFTNTSSGNGSANYNWDFGDGNFSSSENPTHIYGTSGTYLVSLTMTNDCGADTITDSCTVSTVGLEELFVPASFKLYPNPGKNIFNISFELSNVNEIKIDVLDLLGEIVVEGKVEQQSGLVKKTIQLENISQGIYFIRLQIGKQLTYRKWIKAH